jgi:hypothetical protein
MNTRTAFSLGLLVGLILASAMLVGVAFFWQAALVPVIASSPPAASTQTQADINDQINELNSRVSQLESDQAITLRDIAWKMDQKLLILGWTALFISFIAGFLGIKTYGDLDRTIREKVNSTLEKELYQLDPTMLRILIRKVDGMDKVWRRLELSGLQNLRWFDDYGKLNQRGVTIVPIRNKDDEKEYVKAIKSLKPISAKAAFILYAPEKGYFVDPKTLDVYENVSTANLPSTVINAVLAVGRGLKPDANQQ